MVPFSMKQIQRTLFMCATDWSLIGMKQLHGSKVSCESDLRRLPYNRPVCVRSFVINVKSLSEINITLEPYKIT